jgi:hypothetical protein
MVGSIQKFRCVWVPPGQARHRLCGPSRCSVEDATPIRPKAMPVILTSPAEVDRWLEGEMADALHQRSRKLMQRRKRLNLFRVLGLTVGRARTGPRGEEQQLTFVIRQVTSFF